MTDNLPENSPPQDIEVVSCCWICGEPGYQPEDPEWDEFGGCHERCMDEYEKTGKIRF